MSKTQQMALLAPDAGLPPEPKGFRLLFNLLREVATISVVEDLLKAKGLSHSCGTWEDVELKRLRPYLASGKLTMDDLKAILVEAEEHGSSHVFLYHAPKATVAEIINEKRVSSIVKEQGLEQAWGLGRVLEQPLTPSIASIRFEADQRGTALVIKIIQRRLERKYMGESEDGNRILRTWEVFPVRAVSVVRLFSFGLLEIRTTAHWYSTKYAQDVSTIRDVVNAIIPREPFSEFSLQKAKTALWDQRDELKDKIRFSSQTIRTDVGGRLDATGGDESRNMVEDEDVAAGVDAVMKGDGAYCESSNVYWLAHPDGGLPSRETHMVLSGQRNEFAITGGTSKKDYEWVFDQLRVHS